MNVFGVSGDLKASLEFLSPPVAAKHLDRPGFCPQDDDQL